MIIAALTLLAIVLGMVLARNPLLPFARGLNVGGGLFPSTAAGQKIASFPLKVGTLRLTLKRRCQGVFKQLFDVLISSFRHQNIHQIVEVILPSRWIGGPNLPINPERLTIQGL